MAPVDVAQELQKQAIQQGAFRVLGVLGFRVLGVSGFRVEGLG